jgi:enoyl-CoA hydratase/carnithine racemase
MIELPALSVVRLDLVDHVATITLDVPATRNAFSAAMRDDLGSAYRFCDATDEVRAVVLTGTAPAFCAGVDLTPGDATFGSPGEDFSAAGLIMPAWEIRKPVIAAINGHAIGIGLTMALQCDLRVFAADAKYGVVQARRGVLGDAYSHWVLPRLVGIAAAAEILLTGTTFDGRRAVELGLGTRAVPAEDVLGVATEMARDIAVNVAPQSASLSKRLLWESWDLDRASVGARETEFHRTLMGSDDSREGVRAYLERRPPQWTGKVSDLPREPS